MGTLSNKQNIYKFNKSKKYVVGKHNYELCKAGIDKISVTIPVPVEKRYAIKTALCDAAKNNGSGEFRISRAGKMGKHYKNTFYLNLYDLETNERKPEFILVEIEPYNTKAGYIRIEFNPEKFPHARFRHELDFMFKAATQLSFYQFFSFGKITRLDAYLDVKDITLNDYALDAKYKSKFKVYCGGGVIESVYMGVPNKRGYRNYQKNIEDSSLDYKVVRFETSVGGLEVLDLESISNPFKEVVLYNKLVCHGLPKDISWNVRNALDAATFKGMRYVLKDMPLRRTKSIKEAIDESKMLLISDKRWNKLWPSALMSADLGFVADINALYALEEKWAA